MKTEWQDKYVDYERLKAIIKALSETRADKKVHDAVLGKSVPKGGVFDGGEKERKRSGSQHHERRDTKRKVVPCAASLFHSNAHPQTASPPLR